MLLKPLGNKFVIAILALAIIAVGFNVKSKDQTTSSSHKQIAGRPAELPNLAPVDFPVYPGVEIFRMESQPPDKFAVAFGTNDQPKKVFQYLLDGAKQAGWKITNQQSLIFRAAKEEKTVTVSISQKPGEATAILEQVEFKQPN